MKKLSIIILAALLVALCFALSACGHEHSFGDQTKSRTHHLGFPFDVSVLLFMHQALIIYSLCLIGYLLFQQLYAAIAEGDMRIRRNSAVTYSAGALGFNYYSVAAILKLNIYAFKKSVLISQFLWNYYSTKLINLSHSPISNQNKKCGNRSHRTEKRQLQLSPNKILATPLSRMQKRECAFLPK